MKTSEQEVKVIILTPSEGGYITNFKEGDDILTYYGSKEVNLPESVDVNDYREITESAHKEFQRLREEEQRKADELETY